jgi:hypothetical protein
MGAERYELGMIRIWPAWLLLFGACQKVPKAQPDPLEFGASKGQTAASTTPSSAPARPRTLASATPPIVAKADEILRAHPSAELGSEFPFEIDGRKYVARVEEHDNQNGDPNRPIGPHKGITVYHAD